MNIQENISLKEYNTFGIDKKARFFTEAHNIEDILEAQQFARDKGLELFVLGGGSNILLTQDLNAVVLKINLCGIELLEENEDSVLVKVGAGEVWHDFVLEAISRNWAGVENLSLIPGTVGASPMQNIGAYGVEIKEIFHSLEAVERSTGKVKTFTQQECQFGYRESIFKTTEKGKFIITSVTFQLSKQPVFNTSYGAISDTLKAMKVTDLNLKAISDAVIQIRQSKLPDPKKIGNAGSFFKNPTIAEGQYQELKATHPSIPGYPNDEGVKVPAAWLIEQAGWKGKRFGQIGVHELQPLVLVNYGDGEGADIKALSRKIQEDVKSKFGIDLHPEVNFI
ncbi:UDP-N-acetylmuramate dehydrogenase [Litoribacter ruber]|uniref:UDP-N-acetylenolpyruvoylglucosamine reductase n=1 Tax=Litoribacter ruber TaxID=702568 RepID=A0AAP2G1R7_9BACT|nr:MULTISPECIES: UDP-N-acetylmuramate dehydrogenase [Litoribacter]MBS9525064.1 UDP-N-acetylmuramate dehydrogenase [Litoribacter alkaliphilus]MBT0811761.1 UDP-N-acetylmuramate dehydrogenase [Litoribacter ruber]